MSNAEVLKQLELREQEIKERQRKQTVMSDFLQVSAELLTREWDEEWDFERLVEYIKVVYDPIRRTQPMNTWVVADHFTTAFARSGNDVNRLIIEESARRGVKPAENVRGERLEAMTCLAQFLEEK